MKCAKLAVFCVVAIIIAANHSLAEESGKHMSLMFSNGVSARSTPAGFSDAVSLAVMDYYSGSDSILTRNNHIGVGLVDEISPATNAGGVFLEFEPIAVFNLRVQYDYVNYFGLLGAIVTFPDKNSNYSSGIMNHLDSDRIETANGTHFKIQPTLQAEFKRFIMLNTTSFEWFDINKEDYFYEPTNDTLMKTKDYFFSNMTVAGYQVWGTGDYHRIILGARYTYFRVESTERERKQLDGAMIWFMGDKRWFMERPRLVLVAGGFIEDRYREKDFFTGAMFNFEYTLKRLKN